jgi:tryptophan 2,3-dioxygenase
MDHTEIIKALDEKYGALGEKPETYLKGLLQSKPVNYWDYIEVDTLLSLQKPRTDFEDEEIFIMYHQVTELTLKLMLHEIKRAVKNELPTEDFLITRLKRLNRYTRMLINSFGIMKDGMDYNDYNTFRSALSPASGFQSAQFRYIELYCTPVENLLSDEGKQKAANTEIENYFEHIYWKSAGTNRTDGSKTLTLRQFEDKYQDGFIALAKKVKGKTLADRIGQIVNPGQELMDQVREFDRLYNVEWPMVHLDTARHYLDKKGENKAATGGSEWKKYLHPAFQKRRFFPFAWSAPEIDQWGKPEEIVEKGAVPAP